MVSGVGFGLTAPLTALVVTALGGSGSIAGFAVASIAISLLAVDLFGTRWVSRIDARAALSVSALVFGLGSAMQAAASTYGLVILARIGQGFGAALFMGAGVQFAVRLSGPGQEARGLGTFNAAWFAGVAVGPLLGGWLAHFGTEIQGLRLAFAVCAVINLGSAILVRAVFPPCPSGCVPELGLPRLAAVRGWRPVSALALAALGQAIRGGLAMTIVPLLGRSVLGLAATPVVVCLFGLSLVDVGTMQMSDRWSERWGRARLQVVTLLLGAALAVALSVINGLVGFAICTALLGLVVGVSWVLPPTVILDLCEDTEMGLASYRIAADVGMLVLTTLAGVAVSAVGPRHALWWCAAALVGAAVVAGAIGETRRRRTETVVPALLVPESPSVVDHSIVVAVQRSIHQPQEASIHGFPRPRHLRSDAAHERAHVEPGAADGGSDRPSVLPVVARTAPIHPAGVPRRGHRAGFGRSMDRRGWAAMSEELADLTATEMLERFATGEVSPVEVVESCVQRIERIDPTVNAVVHLLAEEALLAARESTRRWAAGTARPLEGVPFGLKDIIDTAGVPTTGGSLLYSRRVPGVDAALASRLAEAGGVLLAKLHTFEFACGGADNQAFGPCRNPWDPTRTTGGSSSGSGAAVAAREVPLAIGTDTGGSIRIPSAYCGLTGLKPTFGRVPRSGVMGLSWTLDHAGPMARSVEDCALMLGVVSGPDRADPTSSTRPVPDYGAVLGRSVRGLRLGRPAGWLEDRMHPEVADAFDESLEVLSALGVEIVPVELPSVELVEIAGWSILWAEMLSLHEPHWDSLEDRDTMGRGLLAATPMVTASDYLRALRFRALWQDELDAAMDGCVGLVVPGATTVAPPLADMCVDIGDERVDWLSVATRTHLPFNLSGSPGLCLPAGTVEGMPVSTQLVGRPHDERSLLTLGAAFQAVTTHHRLRPPLLDEVDLATGVA